MRGRIGRYDVVPTFVDDLLSLTTTTTTDDDGYDNDDKPAEASGTKKIRRARGAGTTVPMDDPDLLSRLRIATTDDRTTTTLTASRETADRHCRRSTPHCVTVTPVHDFVCCIFII